MEDVLFRKSWRARLLFEVVFPFGNFGEGGNARCLPVQGTFPLFPRVLPLWGQGCGGRGGQAHVWRVIVSQALCLHNWTSASPASLTHASSMRLPARPRNAASKLNTHSFLQRQPRIRVRPRPSPQHPNAPPVLIPDSCSPAAIVPHTNSPVHGRTSRTR